MKTKTTLAALLLTAVMVTPSYGWWTTDTLFFEEVAQEYVSCPEAIREKNPLDCLFPSQDELLGYYRGMVVGVVLAKDLSFPTGTTYPQIRKAVAVANSRNASNTPYWFWVTRPSRPLSEVSATIVPHRNPEIMGMDTSTCRPSSVLLIC